MYNIFLLLLCVLIPTEGFAGLNCSANGTFIWHIPGAFTSSTDQKITKQVLSEKILNLNLNKFDLNKQESDVIPIASQGLIQDKFNYYMMSLTQKYGSEAEAVVWMGLGVSEFGYNVGSDITTVLKSGKALKKLTTVKSLGVVGSSKLVHFSEIKNSLVSTFNLQSTHQSVQNSKAQSLKEFIHEISNEDDKKALTRVGKGISMATGLFLDPMGIKNLINFGSIVALEGKLNFDILDAQRDTALASYYTTQDNIKNVAKSITDKLDANQKIIISAHGEGNQLASRAIAQIQNSGTDSQKLKISKYVSVLATSPTTAGYTNKYNFMKHSYDNRRYGGSDIAPNYVLNKNSLKPISNDLSDLTVPSDSGNQGSDFLKYYIGEVVQGIKNSSGAIEQSMRANFIQELRTSAESLQDNCDNKTIFIKVNPKGTYLYTDSHDIDYDTHNNPPLWQTYPNPPSEIDLTTLYSDPELLLQEGDIIEIQAVGEFQCGQAQFGCTDTNKGITGVFSDGVRFLYPGVLSDNLSVVTIPTYADHVPTDIPQDFLIPQDSYAKLQVPFGAKKILFSPLDSNFANNYDPNNDFGIWIKVAIRKAGVM